MGLEFIPELEEAIASAVKEQDALILAQKNKYATDMNAIHQKCLAVGEQIAECLRSNGISVASVATIDNGESVLPEITIGLTPSIHARLSVEINGAQKSYIEIIEKDNWATRPRRVYLFERWTSELGPDAIREILIALGDLRQQIIYEFEPPATWTGTALEIDIRRLVEFKNQIPIGFHPKYARKISAICEAAITEIAAAIVKNQGVIEQQLPF